MRFSKTELEVLDQVARGTKKVKAIAEALRKKERNIYQVTSYLQEKNLVLLNKGIIQPKEGIHITLLLQTLSETPDMPRTLANAKLPLLTTILEPRSIKEIEERTRIKKSMIYTYINELKNKNLIRTKNKEYELNKKLWPKLTETLQELKKYEDYTDSRIPKSSKIYKKTEDEIVFSCKEEINETLTAFSAYEKHGIKLLLTKNYYTLPKRKLTRKEILIHSLDIVEKEEDVRSIIFTALFYAKFKREFPEIKHKILDKINKVLNQEKVENYPSYEEIKDRTEVYNIKL